MANKLELTWVGKNEEVNIEPRLLIENKELSNVANDENTENKIIHGDNLLALKALESKYAGKIKCIYIDPPYNTGSAFEHYDDNLEHSTWLQLMYERILLLYNLLDEDGVFCCQIDDSESSYLKIILDEIFGRQNYLNTFYIQVRYGNKTLAEDSDYQKIIEQCHVYSKVKNKAKLNRPKVEYGIDNFCWKIVEKSSGKEIELGNKKVIIFQNDEYEIKKIEPSLTGLKETWATGSLSRVKASAGEFFELYLSGRKELDGLGCLYKVYGIGEDGLGYRYISGPKKLTASKGKFYSGIPINRLEELKKGVSYRYVPVVNFSDFSASFGNCRLEGGVGFKGGKKPEVLIKMLLDYYTNEGDLILDSFLGSGTTCAVAHKMGRKYIGIEMGEHAYTHCKVRLDKVIAGTDKGGITESVGWTGGGAYRFYELAPTLIKKDEDGIEVINEEYNADMLAAAVAIHEGYTYEPDKNIFWKQSKSNEHSYLYVTTNFVDEKYLKNIFNNMDKDDYLIVVCTNYKKECDNLFKNIKLKKIPKSLLDKCEFDKDNYNLNIINPPIYDEEEST